MASKRPDLEKIQRMTERDLLLLVYQNGLDVQDNLLKVLYSVLALLATFVGKSIISTTPVFLAGASISLFVSVWLSLVSWRLMNKWPMRAAAITGLLMTMVSVVEESSFSIGVGAVVGLVLTLYSLGLLGLYCFLLRR